jgi:[ribosomal protein S18]-alanine N-acetyltransferase
MQMEIVTMTAEHLPQVLEIERESFPLPFSENLFHMELDLDIAHMLVAQEGERVLGYLDFWHVDDEMHVINIAVALKSRGQRIGNALMRYLVDYADKNQVVQIYLDVRASNKAAIALYQSFSFEQIDVRKGYYEDNKEDALVMVRRN